MSSSAVSEEKSLVLHKQNTKADVVVPSKKEKTSYCCFIECLRVIFQSCCCSKPKQGQAEISAAITLQRHFRGRQARISSNQEKMHVINYALFALALPYIDTPAERRRVPTSNTGKTAVYFPMGLPVVLKESQALSRLRFEEMRQARNLCRANGYKHLVIAKARVYKGFIVESRLPIEMVYSKVDQIRLYKKYHLLFNHAVREFMGLICQASLYDLNNILSYDPIETSCKEAPSPRYDNVTLFVDETGVGKIALVDLQNFKPECCMRNPLWCLFKCYDAICLFPYHLELILEEAKKFDEDIETQREKLKDFRERVLHGFEHGFQGGFYVFS